MYEIFMSVGMLFLIMVVALIIGLMSDCYEDALMARVIVPTCFGLLFCILLQLMLHAVSGYTITMFIVAWMIFGSLTIGLLVDKTRWQIKYY